jgi:hypothetical protein
MPWHDEEMEPRKLGEGGGNWDIFPQNGPDHFIWDTGKFALPGTYEERISNFENVQPKLKHWYLGDFPSHLSKINWKIKTMDKPKIEVESMEQIRLNVKRNYPIKYSFGDLSLTFWDDIDHESIQAIDAYFQNDVWSHSAPKKGWGTFKLRDSIVIPQFKITEYTVEGKRPLLFTYYNAVLSSFDFDATDDEGDEAIHTIQMVFKVEGYKTQLL